MDNRYFLLRHGQSKANVGNFILSHFAEGKENKYSLSRAGEKQVEKSIEKAKIGGLLDKDVIIYSSPFSRCKRTAEIAKEKLEVESPIIFDDRLRERWFGDLEKTHTDNYRKVWEEDEKGHSCGAYSERDAQYIGRTARYNAEKLSDVKDRMLELIWELDKKYKNQKILIVSHGDPLQIIQTFFEGKPISRHRNAKHLETAEIRELKNI